MTPPTTDTSREGVDFIKDVSESFDLQSPPKGVAFDRFDSPEPAFTFFENGRIKVSDKLSPEDAAKSAWDCLSGMIGGHNKVVAERDALRDQLAAARNEALDKAKAAIRSECLAPDGTYSPEEADIMTAEASTVAVAIDAIDAIKSTTPAPREDCPECKGSGMRDSGGEQPWGEPIDVPCDCENAPREVTVQEAAPDWEGFGRAIMDDWAAHYDLDAMDRFELAVKHRLLRKIPGGFDPEKHTAEHCDAIRGDDWYEPTFRALANEGKSDG